jgi:hypothetical protein
MAIQEQVEREMKEKQQELKRVAAATALLRKQMEMEW